MLLKFFLNSHSKAHLRGLAEEFGESTNSIRHELNNLSKAGYLVSNGKATPSKQRQHRTSAPELKKLVHNYMGIDKIIDNIVNKMISRLGLLESAFITGDYAFGHSIEATARARIAELAPRIADCLLRRYREAGWAEAEMLPGATGAATLILDTAAEMAACEVVVLPYARYQLPRNAVRMEHADQRVFAYAGQT